MINTNVVEASRRAGANKITAMGTGAVYPFPSPGLPLKEDMIFMGPPHPAQAGYANAKLAMLSMLQAYQESYGLQWAYIVSANLFGPRDRFDTETGNVVPSLIKKFHDAKTSGGDVTVWGDGSAQRDFVYIKDAARIALGVMDAIDGPVNIGSGHVYRIRDVVDTLGRHRRHARPGRMGRFEAERARLSRLRPVEDPEHRAQAGLLASRGPQGDVGLVLWAP